LASVLQACVFASEVQLLHFSFGKEQIKLEAAPVVGRFKPGVTDSRTWCWVVETNLVEVCPEDSLYFWRCV